MHSRCALLFAVFLCLVAGTLLAGPVIIHASKPYDSIRAKVVALGGTVTYEFKNANAIAATLPDDKVSALTGTPGLDYYIRDRIVPSPKPNIALKITSKSGANVSTTPVPATYFPYGSQLTDALPLQLSGILGQGVVVGVIDTGVANIPAISGRVIGGENFVPGAGEPGPNSPLNDPHGTWVSCVIGANVAFLFFPDDPFAMAVNSYCPACSFPFGPFVAIPMVGQAPAARFYALKVFPASGAGAPTSRVMAAMDRAIELKKTTLPNMKVVNMSLGGPTLFAGGEPADELATSMAAAGITLVVAAGNDGPSGMTVGSPGTAQSILTAAAGDDAVHERILRDLQFGPGIGAFYRPDSSQQIAFFSSRGPNADGRNGPTVTANGFASYAEGADGSLSLVSGTSFATPTVAGVATLLYSYKPAATPQQIRSAIELSARAGFIPTAQAVDQGAGYVDAAAAKAILDTNPSAVSDSGPAKKDVAKNIDKGAGINVITNSDFTTHVAGLRPAERREFFFTARPDASSVTVTLSNITPALPPAQQNAFFGDDVLFTAANAKTSVGDYLAFDFVNANRTFTFNRLDSGLMRLTLSGDWTNAGAISADIKVHQDTAPLPKRDFKDKIAQGEFKSYTVTIDPGTATANFRLSWDSDWSVYPTDDLDLYVVSPTGVVSFSGATLNSPEVVTINNPTPGTWTIFVNGFTVWDKADKYEVRVTP